jgi:hypothetical protein
MIAPQSQRAPQRQRADRFGATDRTQRAGSPRAGPNAFPLARLAHHASGSTRASPLGKHRLTSFVGNLSHGARKRVPPATRRRVLELLASCRDGCTEAIMIAHGFSIIELANSRGFANSPPFGAPPICQRRAIVPTYPGAGLTESQVGPNGEFCGHMALIRWGLFKRRSQSRLVISRSVRD